MKRLRPFVSLLMLVCSTSLAMAQQTLPDLLKEADQFSRQKNFQSAVITYQRALELATLDEQRAMVLYYIAHAYRSDKQFDKSEEYLRKILALPAIGDERKSMAYLNLGDIYAMKKDQAQAREYYGLAKSVPGAHSATKVRAANGIARTFPTVDTADKAHAAQAEILQIAGALPTDLSDAWYMMAQASFLLKKLDRAETELTKSIQIQGITDFQTQRGMLGIAGIKKSQGQFEEAIVAYQALLSRPAVHANYHVTALNQLSDCFLAAKQPDQAKACMKSLIALETASDVARQNAMLTLAQIAKRHGQLDEAIAGFQAVVVMKDVYPNYKTSALTQLIECYISTKNLEKAKETLALIQAHPAASSEVIRHAQNRINTAEGKPQIPKAVTPKP